MIIAELSNSVNVTPVVKPLAAKSDAEHAAFREWLAGMNLYMDGAAVAACVNEQQRRGYESANKAEAQFQVAADAGQEVA